MKKNQVGHLLPRVAYLRYYLFPFFEKKGQVGRSRLPVDRVLCLAVIQFVMPFDLGTQFLNFRSLSVFRSR